MSRRKTMIVACLAVLTTLGASIAQEENDEGSRDVERGKQGRTGGGRGRLGQTQARERRRSAPGGPGGMMARNSHGGAMIGVLTSNPKVAEEVGLSEEQIEKLKEGHDELRKELIKTRAEFELAGIDQVKELRKKELDVRSLMKAVERCGELRTEMAKTQIKLLLLVRKTLTSEQIEKAREVARKHARNRARERVERMHKEREKDGTREAKRRELTERKRRKIAERRQRQNRDRGAEEEDTEPEED